MLPYFAETGARRILSALTTVDTSTSQLKVSFTEPVASAFLAKLEFSSLSGEPLRLALGHMQVLGETLLEELGHHLKEKGYFKVRSECSINGATRQVKFDITLNIGL
jgi:phage protein U